MYYQRFNTFMYDHTLHRGRKHLCQYYLQVFNSEEIFKIHIKGCFKIREKQKMLMPKMIKSSEDI